MAIRKSKVVYAGMAELADARDLKSREINFSYRFDPGFRHHYIAEWSSLVARRAHNPEAVRFKSHLRNQKIKQMHQHLLHFFVPEVTMQSLSNCLQFDSVCAGCKNGFHK